MSLMPAATLILAAVFILATAAPAWSFTPSSDQAVITGMVRHYVSCFNRRDADGILELYSPEARIREKRAFFSQWLDVDEYAPKLKDKLAKYAARGAFIVGFDFERLEVRGDIAEVDIAVRARQGIFSATRNGSFELAKEDGGWKIVMDDS